MSCIRRIVVIIVCKIYVMLVWYVSVEPTHQVDSSQNVG